MHSNQKQKQTKDDTILNNKNLHNSTFFLHSYFYKKKFYLFLILECVCVCLSAKEQEWLFFKRFFFHSHFIITRYFFFRNKTTFLFYFSLFILFKYIWGRIINTRINIILFPEIHTFFIVLLFFRIPLLVLQKLLWIWIINSDHKKFV